MKEDPLNQLIKKVTDFAQKQSLIVFPVLVILASLILIVLVIYPQTQRLIEGNRNYQNIVDKSKTLDVKAAELAQIDENSLQKNLQLALVALPTDKDYSVTVDVLQQIVAQAGFNLLSIEFDKSQVEGPGGVSGYSLKIEGVGPRSNLPKLLADLENSSKLMKLRSADISSAKSSDLINAVLVVDSYYSPPPKDLGAIDTPVPQLSTQDQTLLDFLKNNNFASFTAGSSGVVSKGKSNPFE